jgi:hypothetical protein
MWSDGSPEAMPAILTKPEEIKTWMSRIDAHQGATNAAHRECHYEMGGPSCTCHRGAAAACVILMSAILLKQSETHSPRISLQGQNTSQ